MQMGANLNKRLVLYVIAATLGMAGWTLLTIGHSTTSSAPPPSQESLKRLDGIDLVPLNNNSQLPPTLLQQYGEVVFRAPNQQQLQRVSKLMPSVTASYPKVVLQDFLQYIYVYNTLHIDGAEYAGTYSDHAIYLSSRQDDPNELAATFHHELSSILAHRYTFPTEAWINSSSEKILYSLDTNTTHNIMQENTGLKATEALLNEGYLSRYSTTDPENDFNLYAERIYFSFGSLPLTKSINV
jgi:hypothetical protein